MTTRLKNESKRSFQFGDPKKLSVFKPGQVGVFNDETAAALLKNSGVIDLDNLSVDFNEKEMQDFSAPAKKAAKTSAPTDKELAATLKSAK